MDKFPGYTGNGVWLGGRLAMMQHCLASLAIMHPLVLKQIISSVNIPHYEMLFKRIPWAPWMGNDIEAACQSEAQSDLIKSLTTEDAKPLTSKFHVDRLLLKRGGFLEIPAQYPPALPDNQVWVNDSD